MTGECEGCIYMDEDGCHVYISDAWPPAWREGDECPWRDEGDDADD